MYLKILIPIAIVAAIFAVYLPGIAGPFVFDDLSNITNNSFLRIQELSLSSLYSSATSGHAGPLNRPVAMLSFALNYYFAGGYIASAFKISNIAIHSLNAVLVFILCLQLFKHSSAATGKNLIGLYLAAGISLIWAVHPINLTSVLYVVQRMTSLSTLFSLSCIIFYLSARNRWLQHSFSWHVASLFLASLASLVLALYSKENAVLIPLIILCIELTLYSNEKPWVFFKKLSTAQQLTSWAVIFTLCLWTLLWAIDYASGGYDSRPFTMLERILTESRVLCFYISLILIPRINGFGLFHDDIALSTSLLGPWTTLAAIIFILGLLVSAVYYRKKNPLFALGIAWFFIGHLLESTIFALEIAHEHRNNLPSIGIILAAVSLIHKGIKFQKLTFIFLLVSLVLGATTWLRAKQWGNYQSLAYYEASHHPDSPAIQALLSNAANQAGDSELAIQAIKKAMGLDTTETSYAMHYQNILALHGKPIPPELQLETLRRIRANHFTASTQLALDHIAGCLKKAPCAPLQKNYIEWINAVIERQPNNAYYHYFKGVAHRANGDNLLALNAYQQAHNLSGNFVHPLFEMATLLIQLDQLEAAKYVVSSIEKASQKEGFRRHDELLQLKKILAELKK